MYGRIEDYEEYLRIAGWERLGQNIWNDEGVFMFNVYNTYDDLKKSNKIKKDDDYIYCIELDKNCIKIGFSADLNTRLKNHLEKSSAFYGHDHRIALLGPIENGYQVEQLIHLRFSGFATDVYPSNETYYFSDEAYTFDVFMTLFQNFQVGLLLGEDKVFQKMELIKVKQINSKSYVQSTD